MKFLQPIYNMEIYSFINKTKSGLLLKIETSKRGGFPRFNIYYRNNLFNSKEIEDKIKSAALIRKLPYPKGVTVTLITPSGNTNNCSNLDLAIAVSIICKSICRKKILIASSINSRGECNGSDIILSSLIKMCTEKEIEYVILSDEISEKTKNEINNSPDICSKIKFFFPRDLGQACVIFTKLENEQSKNEILPKNENIKDSNIIKQNEEPFAGIIGLDNCKKIIAFSLAGRHNLLILGSRGSGKTVLCESICKIKIRNDEKTRQETEENLLILKSNEEKINSAVSGNTSCCKLINEQNLKNLFKATKNNLPTILAENGNIFIIDDISQFSTSSLMLLKSITSRKMWTFNGETYPLNISVIATSRLCACGNFTSQDHTCTCSSVSRKSYLANVKQTIFDNFDIICNITQEKNNIHQEKNFNTIDKMDKAFEMQCKRYKNSNEISFNCDILKSIDCNERQQAIEEIYSNCKTDMSIGKALKTYCIARTIADCDSREKIEQSDYSMALLLTRNCDFELLN